jgi:hypothetical protein
MSEFVPSAGIENGVLSIRFRDSDVDRSVDLDCVVDLTDFDDVVGVEILDLRRQLSGGIVEPSPTTGRIRWSYDDEMDAFYVHLTDGRGQVQRSVTCKAHLDPEMRFVQLDVPTTSLQGRS